MDVKLTKQFQNKLESLLESQDYKIRFEKGNFKSGYCICLLYTSDAADE